MPRHLRGRGGVSHLGKRWHVPIAEGTPWGEESARVDPRGNEPFGEEWAGGRTPDAGHVAHAAAAVDSAASALGRGELRARAARLQRGGAPAASARVAVLRAARSRGTV